MSEATLIKRAQDGDAAAFDALVCPHLVRVYRIACLITHDAQYAEDSVQEALIRAYRGIRNLHADASFYPWFSRIVVNEAIKQAKRSQNLLTRLRDYVAAPWTAWIGTRSDGAPEAYFESQERRGQLREAIDRLAPAHRAVIVLRYYDDLSEAQMATVLGIPAGTVKSRLYHARAALQRLLHTTRRHEPGTSSASSILHGGDSHD